MQGMREIEVDASGNVYVLAAQATNANDWLLMFDEAEGTDSQICVLLSDGGAGPNCVSAGADVIGPAGMLVSAHVALLRCATVLEPVEHLVLRPTPAVRPNQETLREAEVPDPAVERGPVSDYASRFEVWITENSSDHRSRPLLHLT